MLEDESDVRVWRFASRSRSPKSGARSPDLPLEGPGGLADGVRPGLTAPLGWCCERTWLESLPTIARSPRV